MKRLAIIILEGLGSEKFTEPSSVFLQLGRSIERHLVNGSKVFYFSYATKDLFARILACIKGFDGVVIIGHSFGGSMTKAFCDWAAQRGSPLVELVILFDPCPDRARGMWFWWQLALRWEAFRWRLPADIVKRALCFHQTVQKVGPLGLVGCPIRTIPGRHDNMDLTENGLGHCDIPADSRVQEITRGLILAAAQ